MNADIKKRTRSKETLRIFLLEIGKIPLLNPEEELLETRKYHRYQQLCDIRDRAIRSPHVSPIFAHYVKAIVS